MPAIKFLIDISQLINYNNILFNESDILMKIAITGLPQSGKKTLFNVLTGLDPLKNNIGISKVNDSRIDFLADIFKPKKVVLPDIEYVLLPDITDNETEKDTVFKSLINMDSFVYIARAFKDDSVYHLHGAVDALKDIRNFIADLIMKDLLLAEKRIEKLTLEIKKKPTDEKKKEIAFVLKLKEHLEGEKFIRSFSSKPDELQLLSVYQFLTEKKLMVVVNFSENEDFDRAIEEVRVAMSTPDVTFLGLSVKLEKEISVLDDEKTKIEFLSEMGLNEPACDKMIRFSYASLDMISFFTVGPDEVRAWPVRRNCPVLKAARKIHQDIEKGFIRAEVIKYEDMKKFGTEQKVKEAGLFYLKGKDYTVEDGDIISFRFNV